MTKYSVDNKCTMSIPYEIYLLQLATQFFTNLVFTIVGVKGPGNKGIQSSRTEPSYLLKYKIYGNVQINLRVSKKNLD